MATNTDSQREKDQRLNEVLKRYQMEFSSKYSTVQKAAIKGEGDDTLGNSVVDQSFLVSLITEYDKHLEELNGQLEYYQKQVGEMKLQLENVIKENERSELSRQKLHTQELLSQLEMANEKVVENEKLILEHQEKASRLQRRLSQAEQRAAEASQQLSVVTVQRRKAASMMNLENV
uniref:Sodium channel and clathrin linker 1 n=1 Tax=Molossus molossus TaxID=27622 RepID=A0A7J8ICQ6_MOLMO|nr:sodium channel and clathrin linker 1 [Molossus molossus]